MKNLDRLVFWLSVKGMTISAIAEELAMPVSTIKESRRRLNINTSAKVNNRIYEVSDGYNTRETRSS